MGNISKITVFIISIIILCFTLKDVSKDLIIRDTENIPIANTIDVMFRNEQNNIWRYYYDKTTSYLLVFNSDYETSYKGISYIIDKKK